MFDVQVHGLTIDDAFDEGFKAHSYPVLKEITKDGMMGLHPRRSEGLTPKIA